MTGPIKISVNSLREGRWYEYAVRFTLGGAATVLTGLISSRYGASFGGLFLALPAIFCASATLIEKHEMRRKQEAGLRGERRGQEAAALDAAGAALGGTGYAGVRGPVLVIGRAQRRRCVRRCVFWVAFRLGGGLVRQAETAFGAQAGTQ